MDSSGWQGQEAQCERRRLQREWTFAANPGGVAGVVHLNSSFPRGPLVRAGRGPRPPGGGGAPPPPPRPGAGGGVGIHMVQMARLFGASVAGLEIAESKFDLIAEVGATPILSQSGVS